LPYKVGGEALYSSHHLWQIGTRERRKKERREGRKDERKGGRKGREERKGGKEGRKGEKGREGKKKGGREERKEGGKETALFISPCGRSKGDSRCRPARNCPSLTRKGGEVCLWLLMCGIK
jgi:hypothetical protein